MFDDRLFHALCDTKTPEAFSAQQKKIAQGREITTGTAYIYIVTAYPTRVTPER